jgi:drug/metabolite transporter (DMT)-like permease
MQQQTKAYIQLHICVFLWGFTAILGKLIQVSELSLVWWRLLFTCISLVLIPGTIRQVSTLSGRALLQLAGIGSIVMLHWILFYGSIKYSNASVGVSCLATISFFSAFIEPLVMRKPFKWYEILLGLMVIPGMYIIFHFTTANYYKGILMGLVSALMSSIFGVLNKLMVDKGTPTQAMTIVELSSGWLLLMLVAPMYSYLIGSSNIVYTLTQSDVVYLLILSILCTTVPFIMALKVLRHLSAFTTALAVNLEPVYGILLAIPLLHENRQLDVGFYIGVLIILVAVFAHPWLKARFEKI